MDTNKYACPPLVVHQANADVPDAEYRPVWIFPLNIKIGNRPDALPLAEFIKTACNAHYQLVAALQYAKHRLEVAGESKFNGVTMPMIKAALKAADVRTDIQPAPVEPVSGEAVRPDLRVAALPAEQVPTLTQKMTAAGFTRRLSKLDPEDHQYALIEQAPTELTDEELADPVFMRAYIEGCNNSFNTLMAEVAPLRAALAKNQTMQGMADCMDMVRTDLIEMGIIDKSIAPMFIPEAIAAYVKRAADPMALQQATHNASDINDLGANSAIQQATPAVPSEHDEPTHPNHPGHHDGHTCESAAQAIVDLLSQRAARQVVAPAYEAKDHEIRQLVNDLRDIAIQYRDTQQLRSRIQYAVLPFFEFRQAPARPVVDGAVGRDAARYRYLRRADNDVCIIFPVPPDDSWCPHSEDLDKQVDSILAQQEKAS